MQQLSVFRGGLRMRALGALAVLLSVAIVVAAPPAARAASSFPDVPPSHTFYTHISWLADQGITYGYADGSFGPDDSVTRGQLAAFLYKMAGSPDYTPPSTPTFPDVSRSNTFYKHVEWLVSTGIASGYSNGRFGVSDSVTRGQMAVFLYNLAGSPKFDVPWIPTFPDVSLANAFYLHVEWLATTGVSAGYANGDFGPSASVTRGQIAAFLYKYSRLDASAFEDSASGSDATVPTQREAAAAYCASTPQSTLSPRNSSDLLTAANKERAVLGLAPLTWSSTLASAASGWSATLASRDDATSALHDQLAHNPNAPGAENVAMSYFSAGQSRASAATIAHRGWVASYGHCMNMLSASYSRMGAGMAMTSDGTTWYSTVNFN